MVLVSLFLLHVNALWMGMCKEHDLFIKIKQNLLCNTKTLVVFCFVSLGIFLDVVFVSLF